MALNAGAVDDTAPWLSVEPYKSLYKPKKGDWYRSKGGWTNIENFGYTAYPKDSITGLGFRKAEYFEEGEYIGPVQEYLLTPNNLAVLVKGRWITVWTLRGDRPSGIHFASKVSPWGIGKMEKERMARLMSD